MATQDDLATLAANRRYATQHVAANSLRIAGNLWSHLDRGAYIESWDNAVGPTMTKVMVAGQLAAATGAQDYISTAQLLQGEEPDPAGVVPNRAFAGTASDGRALDTLLRTAVSHAADLAGRGLKTDTALASGWTALERIILTQIGDASRIADSVAATADRTVTGYVRMLTPPSCSRCIVLGGRWYRWNAGFQRHPRCDCRAIPAAESVAGHLTVHPRAHFESMTPAEQARTFTKAGARAIADGADISQVVNARRGNPGLSTAAGSVRIGGRKIHTTTEGTSRHGIAGQRLGKGKPRLMPETIYDIAGDDRDEAIRLLYANGYIT